MKNPHQNSPAYRRNTPRSNKQDLSHERRRDKKRDWKHRKPLPLCLLPPHSPVLEVVRPLVEETKEEPLPPSTSQPPSRKKKGRKRGGPKASALKKENLQKDLAKKSDTQSAQPRPTLRNGAD